MWASSSTDRRPRAAAERGFTLMEAMVSLIILVIVMVVVLSLLFSMKSFAEKQQSYTAPRQTARRALDYIATSLSGAADFNQVAAIENPPTPGNPYALVMAWEWGNATDGTLRRQASFNNLDGTENGPGWNNSAYVVNASPDVATQVKSSAFGTIGTDVISIAFPAPQNSPIRIPISRWDDASPAGVTLYLDYAAGCNGTTGGAADLANLSAFRGAVGAVTETAAGGKMVSSLLIIADGNGAWRLTQLDDLMNAALLKSDCSQQRALATPGNGQVITATIKAPTLDQYFAPGGWRPNMFNGAAFLIAGIDFVSFRHRTVLDPTDPAKVRVIGQLEQKSSGLNPATGRYTPGFFNPLEDANVGGSATTPAANSGNSMFTPIVDSVDDFQIAYIFADGRIWNNAAGHVLNGGGTKIPLQARTPPDLVAAAGAVNVDCRSDGGTALKDDNLDAACVVGLRVSIVGRSQPLSMGNRNMGEATMRLRPSVEDRGGATALDTVTSGVYDRLRLTTTVMLRNRALGY